MNGKNALLNAAVLAILLLSVISPLVVLVRAQAESITTDKGLYAIKWKADSGAVGYVNVTVTVSGLDSETIYEIVISKFHGPTGLNYVQGVRGATWAKINFTIPPTMDARPSDIAGTWNATLYKVVGETRILVKYVNFGIWAINARKINFGRVLQVWGGGFQPNTKVNFTVTNATDTDNITDELFGSSPAVCSVSPTVCAVYGTFSNTSKSIVGVSKGEYNVTIVDLDLLDTVHAKDVERSLFFNITDELIVKILSPANNTTWYRTDTIPVEVEVLYQDLVPVTAGQVKVTFTNTTLPTICTTVEPGADKPKTISLTYSPDSKTWVGSFKIQNNNVTGVWNVTAEANDYYGNHGEDKVKINVKPAILVVESVTAPPASVPRASWVSWVIRVKYKGDGTLVDLDLPKCTVYVVNATTEAVVGSAYVTKVGTGLYNVTWWVPADASLGEYKFLISPNKLYDKVTTCNTPNSGPAEKVLSPSFVVGVTALKVEVKTYSAAKDPAKERVAFTPGSTVYIGAKITYRDSGVVMSAGSVRASIYNATGHLIAEKPMTFDSVTRMWWCEWNSTGAKSGVYDVVVKARDLGYNVGEGRTYFYISGISISPSKGTVPPEDNTKAKTIIKDKVYLIEASIFTDTVSGKKLGTTITITGVQFTPNSKVNVSLAMNSLPYLTGKTILLAMNVATNEKGEFNVSFVFPTAPKAKYTIYAGDAKGVNMSTTFEVIPGLILTPGEIVGSGIINVIGTGFLSNSGSSNNLMLIDGTDAMFPFDEQVENWRTNINGTIVSYSYSILGVTIKPAFILPLIEPKTYTITLYIAAALEPVQYASAKDTIKVVNDIKEISRVIRGFDEVKSIMQKLNVNVSAIVDDMAVLKTDVGYVKTKVDSLVSALSSLNAMITDIKGDVATIKTDVGTVKTNVSNLASLLNTVGAKIDSVSGEVATIKTDVGAIKAKVDVLDTISSKLDSATSAAQGASSAVSGLSTAVWIAVILSLIAAIASIVAIIQVSRKIAG